MKDGLQPVTVGISHECSVVAGPVLWPEAWRLLVRSPVVESSTIEGVDPPWAWSCERQVKAGARHDTRTTLERKILVLTETALTDSILGGPDTHEPKGSESRVVESDGARNVARTKREVI